MSNLYRLADQRARRRIVSFDKRELSRLLGLYSMRVATGEWRDSSRLSNETILRRAR